MVFVRIVGGWAEEVVVNAKVMAFVGAYKT